MLFHVSDRSGIELFKPRPSPYAGETVVWAIDADHVCNYWLPRDCPRVTYYAGRDTTAAYMGRFLGSSSVVIAVEGTWLERLRVCRLYCYEMPERSFACVDECAGYFVCREAVVPTRVEVVDDVLAALLNRGVELRFNAGSVGLV
jgi:hypothetical protein